MKYIKENRYGKIHSLSYKLPHERMENLRLLNNDRSTVDLMYFACVWGQVDIFVEHGLDDAEVVLELALPESVTQPESEKAATGKQGDEEQLLGDDLEGEEGDEEQFLGDDLEGEEAENRDEDDDLMDVECHTASSSDDENREARRVEVEAENIVVLSIHNDNTKMAHIVNLASTLMEMTLMNHSKKKKPYARTYKNRETYVRHGDEKINKNNKSSTNLVVMSVKIGDLRIKGFTCEDIGNW
nr:Zinc finger, PMZ-type [Ipomoea batatas]